MGGLNNSTPGMNPMNEGLFQNPNPFGGGMNPFVNPNPFPGNVERKMSNAERNSYKTEKIKQQNALLGIGNK